MKLYDLHLHSTASDGDLPSSELVDLAAQRGLAGLSLTDHNGVWGVNIAADRARVLGLGFIAGIEMTAAVKGRGIHILGYSRLWDTAVLRRGLAATGQGYYERIQAMVARCHESGFSQVSLAAIVASRQELAEPIHVTYDVTKELRRSHNLSLPEAHRLTVPGGQCYVGYGKWVFAPTAAVALLQQAGGLAILAHPGIVAHEVSLEYMWQLLDELVNIGLAGVEVYHPFHTPELTQQLADWTRGRGLLCTGGSDWHGAERFDDAAFGRNGITEADWQALQEHLTL